MDFLGCSKMGVPIKRRPMPGMRPFTARVAGQIGRRNQLARRPSGFPQIFPSMASQNRRPSPNRRPSLGRPFSGRAKTAAAVLPAAAQKAAEWAATRRAEEREVQGKKGQRQALIPRGEVGALLAKEGELVEEFHDFLRQKGKKLRNQENIKLRQALLKLISDGQIRSFSDLKEVLADVAQKHGEMLTEKNYDLTVERMSERLFNEEEFELIDSIFKTRIEIDKHTKEGRERAYEKRLQKRAA